MRQMYFIVPFLIPTAFLSAATFGTAVSKPGGAAYSDIALDQASRETVPGQPRLQYR